MVNFCVKCRNIYKHQLNDKTKRLEYICSNCNHVDPNVSEIIEISDMVGKTLDYNIDMNIIYDYTFPRTKKIACQNKDCTDGEIILFKYNPKMYNSAYLCSKCFTYWKN